VNERMATFLGYGVAGLFVSPRRTDASAGPQMGRDRGQLDRLAGATGCLGR
jgi:hypothetical protein